MATANGTPCAGAKDIKFYRTTNNVRMLYHVSVLSVGNKCSDYD